MQGTKVTNGAVIRLQHGATRKWLHSHLFYSPLSNNQEVSCFGDETNSDTGDWWHIEWDGKGDKWQRDMPIRCAAREVLEVACMQPKPPQHCTHESTGWCGSRC